MTDRLKDLEALEVSLVPKAANKRKFLLLKSLKNPIFKTVVPFQDLPLASRDRNWDGDEAEMNLRQWASEGEVSKDNMDWVEYRRGFLWYNEEEPENFTSYKFGIADIVDDELMAIPQGIFAAAAILEGAMLEGSPTQSLNIPDDAIPEMKDHLTQYYMKMQEEWDDESLVAPFENSLEGGDNMPSLIKQALADKLRYNTELEQIFDSEHMEEEERSIYRAIAKIFQNVEKLNTDVLNKILVTQQEDQESTPGIGQVGDLNPDLPDEAENAVIGAFRILQEYADDLPDAVLTNLANLVGGMSAIDEIIADSAEEVNAGMEYDHMGRGYAQELPKKVVVVLKEVISKLEEVSDGLPDGVIPQLKAMTGEESASSYTFDAIEKSLDGVSDSVRKQIKKLFKEKEDIRKELKAKEEKEREKQFISKAESEFDALPVNPSDFGLILKGIEDNMPDKYEQLEKIFKTINGFLKENDTILKEIGSGQSNDDGLSNWSKIEKRAEIMLEEETGLSKEQAINRVLQKHPELYKNYLAESGQ